MDYKVHDLENNYSYGYQFLFQQRETDLRHFAARLFMSKKGIYQSYCHTASRAMIHQFTTLSECQTYALVTIRVQFTHPMERNLLCKLTFSRACRK